MLKPNGRRSVILQKKISVKVNSLAALFETVRDKRHLSEKHIVYLLPPSNPQQTPSPNHTSPLPSLVTLQRKQKPGKWSEFVDVEFNPRLSQHFSSMFNSKVFPEVRHRSFLNVVTSYHSSFWHASTRSLKLPQPSTIIELSTPQLTHNLGQIGPNSEMVLKSIWQRCKFRYKWL